MLMGGITGPIWTAESWGIDWHVDYVSLGHVTSKCNCTPIDANYDTATKRMIANPVPVPNADFIGGGNAQGVALMLEPYVRYRGWRIGIEAGIFPYRPAWDETVYNWTIVPGVAPTTISAHTSHGVQLGRVVGVSIGRGPLSISYQHYWLPTRYTDGQFQALWTGADVLIMTYRF